MKTDRAWVADWLDGVVDGKTTMSQRAMSSIEAHGGIDHAIEAARRRGVHLVQLTDDRGRTLVAASLKPFRTLC